LKTSPSKSYLLATTVPHSCVPRTHAKIVTRKKVHFPLVLSSAPRLDPHTDCSFLSCSRSKCNSFKNSNGLWLFHSQMTVSCQQRAGCKCDQCRKFYTLSGNKWNEVYASHSFSLVHLTTHIGATPVVNNVPHTVQPTKTLHKSTAIHLIPSSATFLVHHSEWLCDLLSTMTQWCTCARVSAT